MLMMLIKIWFLKNCILISGGWSYWCSRLQPIYRTRRYPHPNQLRRQRIRLPTNGKYNNSHIILNPHHHDLCKSYVPLLGSDLCMDCGYPHRIWLYPHACQVRKMESPPSCLVWDISQNGGDITSFTYRTNHIFTSFLSCL